MHGGGISLKVNLHQKSPVFFKKKGSGILVMEREHLKAYYQHNLEMVLQRLDPKEFGYNKRKSKHPVAGPMNLTENNRKLLKQYYRHMPNENIALSRISLVLGVMGRLLEMLGKDFQTATKEDILGSENTKGLVTKINEMNISAVTKSDYLKKLKSLDKWLNGNEEPSDRTRKIKTGLGKKHLKLPSQLLTPEEAQTLINATDNTRDRALFHFLWESGCRVGEAINLKLNSIQFDKGDAKVTLFGKVGERQILLLESVRDLKEYIKTRALANQDQPLFIMSGKEKGKPLSHGAISKTVKRTAIRAGINKRVHAYLFRHSRASYLASKGLSETQLCMIFGWEIGSKQVRTYIHLSGAQVQNALLEKVYGIKRPENHEQELTRCQICGETNPYGQNTCQNCYNPLTIQGALKIKQENQLLQQDRDISQQVFTEALKLITEQKITPEQAQTEAIKIIAQKIKQNTGG